MGDVADATPNNSGREKFSKKNVINEPVSHHKACLPMQKVANMYMLKGQSYSVKILTMESQLMVTHKD